MGKKENQRQGPVDQHLDGFKSASEMIQLNRQIFLSRNAKKTLRRKYQAAKFDKNLKKRIQPCKLLLQERKKEMIISLVHDQQNEINKMNIENPKQLQSTGQVSLPENIIAESLSHPKQNQQAIKEPKNVLVSQKNSLTKMMMVDRQRNAYAYLRLLKSKRCEICQQKHYNEEQSIIYCSNCEDAYHMYCLESPLTIQLVQKMDKWFCNLCQQNTQYKDEMNQEKVENNIEEINQQNYSNYLHFTKDLIRLTDLPKKSWTKRQNYVYNLKPFDPLIEKQTHWLSLIRALTSTQSKYCPCQVYESSALRDLNQSKFHRSVTCETLSKHDQKSFEKFLDLVDNNQAPPLVIEICPIKGYLLRALKQIEQKTILCEYAGEIMTYRESLKIENDSMFKLLETGSSKRSLDIVPQKYANLSKYLLGINNGEIESLEKINIQSLLFSYKGRNRVILYAKRRIREGEALYVDYNGGICQTYPTETFI